MTPQRYNRLNTVLSHRQADLTVLLENVFDPHNISAVMRTCDAVGIQHIYILNDRIPPHKKWSHKTSSTADKWLTIHQYDDAEKCFADLRKKYGKIYTSYLGEGSADIFEMDFTGSMVLVFGNETVGVSEHIRKYADGNFIIPQVGVIKSLNISVACAVTLYEAFRQKNQKGHYQQSSLPESDIISLKKEWGLEEE
jgi:tRNA (guanosine-2'-O-)-methyltransferase